MSQEQSSILTPKNDLIGVKKTKKVTNESFKLPQPTGWRILILPFKMNDKTKGGVYLGESTLEKQQVGSQCGNAGSRIKIEGGEVRLLNDDEILATIKNPEDILHEY
jgi:co-chaperonin GroES (HSP10)